MQVMADDENCSSLDELKKAYNIFKEKYGLLEFSELNKLFDIEDIDVDTEFLLRKIRRIISERIIGYLRFVEVILNPSNAPIFFFKLIKKLDNSDREELIKIHETLGKLEIEIVSLDLDCDELKEADFIKRAADILSNQIKTPFMDVIYKLNNGEGTYKKENNETYFG